MQMVNHHSVERISLGGPDWRIHEDAEGTGVQARLYAAEIAAPGWTPARVPGNVQADLEAAHHLNPLWYGAGDPRLAEVAHKDWWYRRDFGAPGSFAGKRLKLVFDGVDYACEVWLNGQRLGAHAGMFRRFGFDVAGIIKPGGINQLAVKIERMPAGLARILAASDGKMSGGGGENFPEKLGPNFFVKGINQTRQLLQGLKSPTNFGWDWGVNIYTLGIWQDVRLEATGPARMEWVQVLTELSDDQRQARVRVRLELNSLTAMNANASFRIHGHEAAVEATINAALRPGDNQVDVDLVLNAPSLWWPNGHGDQPLYELETRLEDEQSGRLLDNRITRFGVREIRWKQVEGAPADFINPYQLVINGRPVRMLGSNIIPPDLLFGRINERGPRLIRLAQQAGINTLRVWGGGALLTEEMFDLADELGIMLSLEFPLANCRPETDPVFLGNLESTVRQIVRRYRNHACIIEWSGGNEMLWFQGEDHPALQLLARVTAETDSRLFRATCPMQGARHSPWNYDPETHYAHYDNEELLDNGMRPGENKMMRYGEFGCQTPAHLEVWQREIPPADQWPPDDLENPILIRKNVVQAVFTEQYWLIKPTLDTLFGPVGTLEALVAAGQYLGAHGLRYAVDALRRRGKRIGGMTTWDYNEPWPNSAGSYLVDYDGRPLMNYSFMKQALAPVSLSLRYSTNVYKPAVGLEAELWLVSDAPGAAGGLRWQWLARDHRGRILVQNEGQAAIQPLEAVQLDVIQTRPQEEPGPILVELSLADADGQVLGERLHLFGPADSAAPLAGFLQAAADELPVVRRTHLDAGVHSQHTEGDTEVLQIELTNRGRMTAIFCEPHPLLSYRTDLVIQDNHTFIPPGEKRMITILGPVNPQEGLTLAQTGWRLTCWNAEEVVIPPSDDVLLSVGRKDAMTGEYLGYGDLSQISELPVVTLEGNRPDAAALPLLMKEDYIARFVFKVSKGWEQPARLRLHTADQDHDQGPLLELTINGRRFEAALGTGLGIQNSDPAHMAFPATVQFDLPRGTLKAGPNTLEVRIKNASWFSWDSLDLLIHDG